MGVFEQRIHDNGFMAADGDLSAKQYLGVKISGNLTVAVCDTAGEFAYGILQNKPAAGETANVRDLGISRAIAGAGGLTAGDKWQVAADGTIITAAAGDNVGGVVLQGAAAGNLAVVTVGYGNWPVLA